MGSSRADGSSVLCAIKTHSISTTRPWADGEGAVVTAIMQFFALLLLALLLLLVAIALLWRWRGLACPARHAWLLENPYMRAVAGSELILARARVEPGMSVLDVGCGVGRIALPAARRVGAEGFVVGLDIQPAMLAKLRVRKEKAGIQNVFPILVGAGGGAIASNCFDRALLVTVLGEIGDKTSALAEIFQALKPGGVLSVTEVIPDPHYQRRRTVSSLCEAAGFEPAGSFGGALAFTIDFIKPCT